MSIQKKISAEPITQFARMATMENFVYHRNREMTLQVSVQTLNAEGVPFTEAIAADEQISGQKEQFLLGKYRDTLYTKGTAGVFCLPNGDVVSAETENAMPMLTYLRKRITLGLFKKMGMKLNDETSLLDLIDAMLVAQIDQIDRRGEL